MSQTLKASLLVLGGFAIHYAITPPHPPATKEEKTRSHKVEDFMRVPSSRLIPHLAFALAPLVEVTALLCSAVRAHAAVPERISDLAASALEYLTFPGGDLQNIRLTPAIFAGLALTCFAGWVRLECYRALGKFFTFELSVKKDHKLVKTGPYAWVRHPGYFAIVLVIVGSGLAFGSPGSWLRESGFWDLWYGKATVLVSAAVPMFITVGLLDRLPREEKVLRETFGAEWEQWAKDVPAKLIPFIY